MDNLKGLGKIRIEYKQDGNLIQVFNAPDACTLVINGQMADQYRGYVAGRFKLYGWLIKEDEKIEVKVSAKDANIGRFPSPVVYKPCKEGILVMLYSIPALYGMKARRKHGTGTED